MEVDLSDALRKIRQKAEEGITKDENNQCIEILKQMRKTAHKNKQSSTYNTEITFIETALTLFRNANIIEATK